MNLQFTEILIILVIALVLLGPRKLPDLARSIGKGMREMRRATDELKNVWDEEVDKPTRQARQALTTPPRILPSEHARALDEGWPQNGKPTPEPPAEAAPAAAAPEAPAEAPAPSPDDSQEPSGGR